MEKKKEKKKHNRTPFNILCCVASEVNFYVFLDILTGELDNIQYVKILYFFFSFFSEYIRVQLSEGVDCQP